jgi:hypothetical protein
MTGQPRQLLFVRVSPRQPPLIKRELHIDKQPPKFFINTSSSASTSSSPTSSSFHQQTTCSSRNTKPSFSTG